jgi:FtsP/CotA-like multicopper oxidase with cupredoxin domain
MSIRVTRLEPVVAAIAMLALIGCSTARQLTPQTSQASASPVVSVGPSASPSVSTPSSTPATPSPLSGVTSATTSAVVGPKGSIRDEMYSLAYHPGDITAKRGALVIFLVNPANKSLATHAMVIGTSVGQTIVRSDDVLLGQSAIFTVRGLPPGKYVFWCPIDDHADEGMIGSLTIR